MEAGDAVSLMTVHNAKGLEWPIVILPDITGRPAGGKQKVLFEAQHGVAFEVEDEDGELLTPALFTLLDERRREREAQEEFRVLYVALTRARDRVIISGNEEDGGRLRSLAAGLTAAAVEPNLHEYDPQAALPKTPRAKAATSLEGALLGHSGAGLFELPVSSLASYAACPKRFHFEQVLRHPGAGEGRRLASRVGSLTHLALEREIRDAAELGRFDRPLEREHVERALELADTFRTKQLFRQLRQGIRERERPVRVEIEGLVLHGVVDAVGDGFILDYKTGRRTSGEGHLLQVAVYAMALERPVAHLAYLATNELVSYQEQQLASARKPISLALHGIASGDFTATPSSEQCGNCNFSVICSDSAS